MAFLVAFVPGPGVGFENTTAVMGGDYKDEGATAAEVLAHLRAVHAEQGWADELDEPEYRKMHEWGAAMIALFEQCEMPVAVPVRHGAFVVSVDVS